MQPPGADLVLSNAHVITMAPSTRPADGVAIVGDRIVAVGCLGEFQQLIGPNTETLDLEGRTVIPGLADCHVHLANHAALAGDVDARDLIRSDVGSLEDIFRLIATEASRLSFGTWIAVDGSPLPESRLREGRLPTRWELDRVCPNHPCYIAFGAHRTVANSRALSIAGVDETTPDPPGGKIGREGEDLTGLLEEKAQWFVRAIENPDGPPAVRERMTRELELCARRGVTTIHDMVLSPDEIAAYIDLDRNSALPVRVQMIWRVIEGKLDRQSVLDLGLRQGFGSESLKLGGVKMSIDGADRNAANYDGSGLIRIDQQLLDETIEDFHRIGVRCCVHAIGELALDMALSAFERAQSLHPNHHLRHRVEHMGNWAMTPERLHLAARLGLTAVPNPAFLYYFGSHAADVQLSDETRPAFPFRKLLENQIPFVFGSDGPPFFPVDPLRDIGIAVHRTSRDGRKIAAEQSVSWKVGLWAQTVGAALAGMVERDLGTIEVGKCADMAVLDGELSGMSFEQPEQIPVAATVTGGRIVYRKGL